LGEDLAMFFRNLRHAVRQFLKVTGFTLSAILTLALGIGANTAIFSVVNAVLRHPSGVDRPERIVIQNTRYRRLGMDFPGVSVPDYADATGLHNLVEVARAVWMNEIRWGSSRRGFKMPRVLSIRLS
jgi:hypothetical protein